MGLSLAQRPQQINCSLNCNSFQLANSDSESATVLGPEPAGHFGTGTGTQTRLCPPRLRGAAGLDAWLPAAQADVQASKAARQLPVGAHLLLVQCRHLLPAAAPSCLRGSSSSFLPRPVLHAYFNLQLQLISTVGPIDKAMLTLLM